MSFTYRLLNEKDIHRIFQDAIIDDAFTRRLDFIHKQLAFPIGWCVSNTTNEYLFYLPNNVRSIGSEFYFFTEGTFLQISSFINCEASFIKFPNELESIRSDIQSKAAQALILNPSYVTFFDKEDFDSMTDLEIKKRLPTFIADNCIYDV